MKFILIIALIAISITLISCLDNRSEGTKIAHRLIKETIDEMNEVHGLTPFAISEAEDKINRGKYKEIGLNFAADHRMSKFEARVLLLDIADRFLNRLNANEKKDLFMGTAPFVDNNIDVSISISPSDGSRSTESELIGFHFIGNQNCIMYSYPVSDNIYGRRHEFETIEEARKLVQEQHYHL